MLNQRWVISLLLILGCWQAYAQPPFRHGHFGLNVGFISSFGTHTQRFGISVQGYAMYRFAQMNAEFRLYDNFKNLGPSGEYAEMSTSLGLVLAYGKKHHDYNRFISPVSNQTRYNNSVGYAYTIWANKIKTSQQTGLIALQFGRFSIITENDLLAKPILDRFRTGAVLLQYQDKHIQYALNCTMWTGQMGHAIRGDKSFPGPGYMDTTGGVYTRYSHGLLSVQVKYADANGQFYQANAGVDAEQVRNFVQNRLIHDMVIIPRKWFTPTNCHIPMIDTNGNQYLYKPGQKIRKPRPYVNFGTDQSVFY